MDHSQQLRLPPLPFLLLFLLILHCPIIKGCEEIDPPPNRTDIRESCPHVFQLLFDTDNYTLVDNGTALWIQGDYFNVSFYDNLSRPVICRDCHLPLVVSETVILITGMCITSLSILASMALLITYTLFRTLRTFPSKVIMNLAAAFLAGDVCYMVRLSLLFSGISEKWTVLTLFVVWWYLMGARYMWMSLAGFEMSRTIYDGINLRFASERKRKKLLIVYILLGWGVPLPLSVVAAAVEFTDNQSKYLFGIYGYIIIGFMFLFNIGIVIFLSFMLYNAAKSRNKLNHTVKRRNPIFVRVFLVILTVLGLPRVLVFLMLIREVHVNVFTILDTLLNISQPLIVSIAFIGTKKVIRKYLELCGCKDKDKKTNGRQKNSNSAQQQKEQNTESTNV